jgi:aspartyl-tRNA(Asn)/glutamyl-tRNA(Gln) amidotransferase subunit C
MAISLEEVEKIAKLAKLKFSDIEKQKLQHELSAILDYVDQLKNLDNKTLIIEDDPDAVNLMRDDIAEPVTNPAKFLEQAPAKEGDYLKVKSILE